MKNINEIEKFAHDEYIPIARKAVVEYMDKIIKENNYHTFLEIGTAIGYTSICLYKNNEDFHITTIEKNEKRAKIAKENFIDNNILDKINFIVTDATLYETNSKFDLIFIDASKKKNKYYLDKFTPNLNQFGTIIIDNMNLEDLWVNCDPKKKKMFDKVNKDLKEYIENNELYNVKFFDEIGDGIAVITLK